MATEVGALYYDLDIDDKNLKKQLNDADRQVKNLGDSISRHWDNSVAASQRLATGLAVAGGAAVAFGISSIKAFADSEAHIAALTNTLKSTGSVSGQTVEGLQKMATQLQSTTGFADEFVMEAQNMLLTFTKVGKEVFPEATRAALDMARQFGGGAQENAIRLGKALQDPIAGVSALSRIGVQFSEVQKQQIQNFMDAGDVMGAQKVILGEIATQTKGAAEAYGKTFAGQVDILKNSFGDLQEGVGEMLVAALQPLTGAFADWMEQVNEAGGLLEYLKNLYKENEDAIIAVAGAIAGALVPAFTALAISIGRTLIYLAPFIILGAALAYLWKNNKLLFFALTGAILGFAIAITVIMMPAIIAATAGFATMAVAVIAATWPFILIGAAVAAAAYLIITNWDSIWNFLKGVFNWIANNWPLLLGILLGPFGLAVGFIIKHFEEIKSAVTNFFSNAWDWLYNAGKDLINGLVRGIKDKFGEAVQAVKDIGNGIVNAARDVLDWHSPSRVFIQAGKSISEGLAIGIKDGMGAALSAMDTLSANVISPQLNVNQGVSGVQPGNSIRHGDTIVQIGEINNREDADYVLRRIDRNYERVSMGISPG